jgi:hypothetical protein
MVLLARLAHGTLALAWELLLEGGAGSWEPGEQSSDLIISRVCECVPRRAAPVTGKSAWACEEFNMCFLSQYRGWKPCGAPRVLPGRTYFR